ncbi:uncharacterized protein PHACADRAFT_248309 [Phanerochaete carnosa HHB-10118-sp]|uniref:Uncharacterized protein n=1 Tax=Phanerochaete carnosa (strain HHB-10118-sp) TaxID=650164 RepID=K5XEV0_PHACS|nr:uncharacterized protein PHACADRAFT_248309 [Phanerochaete carnosa HHB-10118-sp]EKM61612.1 hypothetical protein PHACADRAFT_248309 [Phanerochaete carnosa HHB-10118-sp]
MTHFASEATDPRSDRVTPTGKQSSSESISSSPSVQRQEQMTSRYQPTGTPPVGATFQSAKELAMVPSGDDGYHEGDNWLNATSAPGAPLSFQSETDFPDMASSFMDHPTGVSIACPSIETKGSKLESSDILVGFQTGTSLLDSGKATKTNSWSAPSAESLAKAAERMKRWEAEIDEELSEPFGQDNTMSAQDPMPVSQLPTFGRVALKGVENSAALSSSQSCPQVEPPDTPTPVRTAFKRPSSILSTPLGSRKPFKSPLLNKSIPGPSFTPSFSSPLIPTHPRPSTGPKPPSFTPPLKAAFPSVSFSSNSPFVTPTKKSLGLTPRRLGVSGSAKKPNFFTPFKVGMKPGEPGRAQLEVSQRTSTPKPSIVGIAPHVYKTPAKKDNGKGRAAFFDLGKGLVPHAAEKMTYIARI